MRVSAAFVFAHGVSLPSEAARRGQRSERVAQKAVLNSTRQRIGYFHRHVTGPRKRNDLVVNTIRTAMPVHRETLFALFGVLGQCAISKSATPDGAILVDSVNNLATVE
jgi:hypothetical protein